MSEERDHYVLPDPEKRRSGSNSAAAKNGSEDERHVVGDEGRCGDRVVRVPLAE